MEVFEKIEVIGRLKSIARVIRRSLRYTDSPLGSLVSF